MTFNLRTHKADTLSDLESIVVMNTANLTPLEAIKVKRDYAQRMARSHASSLGALANDLDLHSPYFISSVSVGQMIYEYIEQELLSAYDAATEAEEKNALDAMYVREVA